ncbi:MAG: 9-O-acetylesterase [Planctomycetaceae bacterium]|nr:9-O-acetylesterase [Planctomycetaceae bacterium]
MSLAGFRLLMTLVVTVSATSVFADVRLPGFYTDHMVLQQKIPVRLRGWADPGENVAVTLGEASAETHANDQGLWQIELPARSASKTPVKLVFQGKNRIELSDILIGEVWLCSGQSNMEWSVAASTNAQQEIAAANYPLIRQMQVAKRPSTVPLDDISAEWQVCSPATAGGFTACGYFMARHLFKELDVPIGLINSSWGGTRVEPWTPPVGFQQVEQLHSTYESVMGRTPGTAQYEAGLKAHIGAVQDWLKVAESRVGQSEVVPASPAFPDSLAPYTSHQDPTMLYNGMIHALVGFPLRGAIWYQGESNHGEGMLYYEKKKALIGGWRELWQQGDFPFYYVQIAPFQYGGEDPEILAVFWEAQAAVQQVPNTGMVVINDIATLQDIHPPNKQDVGLRLAQLALKNDYGRNDLVADSPEFDSLEVLPGKLKVTFRRTGGGLKTRDGKAPSHFEVIGPGSGGFLPAEAVLDGDTVTLTCDKIASPVAFRFAWHKLAEPNLIGATGLPVGACRGGQVPDFVSMLPVADQYTLVYDLDLGKLGGDIRYDVDNSRQVKGFDRVAYLLELRSEGSGDQKVFVSMDAFTDDIRRIGIPTAASGASFACNVTNMDVYTTESGLKAQTGSDGGNIEFWPDNYGTKNGSGVPGANDGVYDFGDERAVPVDGYGCMQIHDHVAGQTLLAINHWKMGGGADLGIGNSSGQTRDWTFTSNAASYTSKRLRVYVRAAN